jgi:hypothetical protein
MARPGGVVVMVALVTNLEWGGQGKGANTEEEGKGWSHERDKGEKRRGHEEKQEETCPQSTMEHREEKSKGQQAGSASRERVRHIDTCRGRS